jgi:hypothetical protein
VTWTPPRIGTTAWLKRAFELDAKEDRVKDKFDEVPYSMVVPKQVVRMHPGMTLDRVPGDG